MTAKAKLPVVVATTARNNAVPERVKVCFAFICSPFISNPPPAVRLQPQLLAAGVTSTLVKCIDCLEDRYSHRPDAIFPADSVIARTGIPLYSHFSHGLSTLSRAGYNSNDYQVHCRIQIAMAARRKNRIALRREPQQARSLLVVTFLTKLRFCFGCRVTSGQGTLKYSAPF